MSEESILYKIYYGCRIFQSVIAIAFNLVILISVVRYKYLRSSANLLVGSIAFTDFLHALATAIVLPLRFLPLPWFARTAICISGMTTEALTVMSELASFALLSMERWNSLLAQLNKSKKWTNKRVFFSMVFCWMVLCMWNIGMAVFKEKQPSEGMPCVVFIYFPAYYIYVGFGIFLVSSALIAYFYMRIACVACSSAQRVAAAGLQSNTQQQIRKDLTISKMMAKVVGVFFSLYCPFFIIAFTITEASPTWHRILYYISILVYDVNFWINPFIYAWGDKNFKKAFEDLLPNSLTSLWKTSNVPTSNASQRTVPNNKAPDAGPSGTTGNTIAAAVLLEVKPAVQKNTAGGTAVFP